MLGAACALTLGMGTTARSQEAAAPIKHYYNKTSFKIPVVIDEQERATLTELKLYARVYPAEWTCAATAAATQKSFAFQAQHDGEYWFNIATVDRAGKMVPEDLRGQPPALIVIVDTQPPEIDVKPLTVGSGHTYLQCRLIDANPDYATVKIHCQADDGTWQALPGMANMPGVVQVPDP